MEIQLFNRQRVVPLDLDRLHGQVAEARAACLRSVGPGRAVLESLESIEISVVSDRVIASVHRRFLKIAGATDVITFDHGEIVVSATTASRRAIQENEELDREVFRYMVHGLLHLNGHLDEAADDAAVMWNAQEGIVNTVWPRR